MRPGLPPARSLTRGIPLSTFNFKTKVKSEIPGTGDSWGSEGGFPQPGGAVAQQQARVLQIAGRGTGRNKGSLRLLRWFPSHPTQGSLPEPRGRLRGSAGVVQQSAGVVQQSAGVVQQSAGAVLVS